VKADKSPDLSHRATSPAAVGHLFDRQLNLSAGEISARGLFLAAAQIPYNDESTDRPVEWPSLGIPVAGPRVLRLL